MELGMPLPSTASRLTETSTTTFSKWLNIAFSTDYIGINPQREIIVFAWNSDNLLYEKVFNVTMVDNYVPKSIYLVDISGDGRLDFVVWGVSNDSN